MLFNFYIELLYMTTVIDKLDTIGNLKISLNQP